MDATLELFSMGNFLNLNVVVKHKEGQVFWGAGFLVATSVAFRNGYKAIKGQVGCHFKSDKWVLFWSLMAVLRDLLGCFATKKRNRFVGYNLKQA